MSTTITFYDNIFLLETIKQLYKPMLFSPHHTTVPLPIVLLDPLHVPKGKNPTEDYLETMMNEAPGPINFTMFLTMFGEKLNGTDPEDVIRNAFACFDEEATGRPMAMDEQTDG